MNDRHESPDAESVENTARTSGVGRSTVYKAISLDPEKREGLPFLPSIKLGKRRLIRVEARRKWLAELEALSASRPDTRQRSAGP